MLFLSEFRTENPIDGVCFLSIINNVNRYIIVQ